MKIEKPLQNNRYVDHSKAIANQMLLEGDIIYMNHDKNDVALFDFVSLSQYGNDGKNSQK